MLKRTDPLTLSSLLFVFAYLKLSYYCATTGSFTILPSSFQLLQESWLWQKKGIKFLLEGPSYLEWEV